MKPERLASMPYWPAAMTRKEAAAYLCLSEAKFEQEVNAGTLPLPIELGGRPHWSRRKLDEALEVLHGEGDVWTKLGLGHAA